MRIWTLILAFLSISARAELIRDYYQSARATSLGGAFLALDDDSSMLWYNPAGLARVKGVHASIFDFQTGFDSTNTLGRMQGAVGGDFSDLIRSSGGEDFRLNIRPTLIVPYFGFSLFTNAQSYTNFQNINTTSASVDIDTFNDLGGILAVGIPFGQYLSVGASVRVFERTGIQGNLTTQQILNMAETDPSHFQSNVYKYLEGLMGTGWGVGLNMGALFQVPLPAGYPKWTLGATLNDIGQTSFRPVTAALPLPQPIPATINVGTALEYTLSRYSRLNLALDLDDNFSNLPFIKQAHFGMEYRYAFLSLRGGLYQGYPTYGFGVEFPPHTKLIFSSFSEEVGNHIWDQRQQFYLLQFEIGFNPL